MKDISAIITPTWNNEDYTIRCFDSIRKNTKNYKIIWIDNGSTEESRNKVKRFLDKNNVPHELILNKENLGFVKATNQGMKKAMEIEAKYLVLQNNDTEVYEGWLGRFIEVAESDPGIGLVGPITSPCESWQSIDNLKKNNHKFFNLPNYDNNPEEYSKIIKEFYKKEKIESKTQLAFFSVLIKQEVVEKIGVLSEEFGVGFGDDDDYCIRAMKNGWKLFLAKDVFVFHNHRTTFKSIYSKEKIKEMLDNNGKIYKNKHQNFLDDKRGNVDICFISHSSAIGGSEKSMLELIKDLQALGLRCYVTLPSNGLLEDELKRNDILCGIFSYGWWVIKENNFKKDVLENICANSASLFHELKKINPKLIYTNTSVINIGSMVAKELGVPHIWHIREYGENDHGFKFILGQKDRFRYIDKNSDFVIFNSRAVSDFYKQFSDFENSEVVYNNVELKKVDKDTNPFLRDSSLHLLIAGNVYAGKGQKDAVLAVKKLKESQIDVELVIAGNISNQDYKNEIEKIIEENKLEENIKFIGFLDNIFQVMKFVDVSLVCSKNEAFGRVTAEAMLSKKPVIGTDRGGTKELIVNNKNGLLYKPENVDDLVEKIKFFIDNPQKIKEFGENGHRLAKENFSKENYSKKIEKIIREVLSQKTKMFFDDIFLKKKLELLSGYDKLKDELFRKDEQIKLMEDSKFWKIRNNYLYFRDFLTMVVKNPERIFGRQVKFFKKIYEATIFSFKNEGLLKVLRRIINYVFYGKGVLKKKELKRSGYDFKKEIYKTDHINFLDINSIGRLSFKEESAPKISIIIPVYSKWKYTYNCLCSLKRNTKNIPKEIIIVDDGSFDETEKMIKKVSGIVYIKNKSNLGFVGSCNVGAKRARGEYVVFLNNDTWVKKDWLEALLSTFEENENVGLVGSKLIYPDGRLQEAGGIVWRNENVWNYGRFMNPRDPEFNYLKDVDYCSGASIMLPKIIFDKLNGFDEIYSPGYFEDTDLAFRVREMGYRTVYQPKSEAYHFEGITSGNDLGKGMKRYQVVNKKTFFNRWRDVLVSENLNDNEGKVFIARDRGKNKKIILFMDNNIPTFDKDAGSFIAVKYLEALVKLGYKVIFWPHNLLRDENYINFLQQKGIEVIYGRFSFKEYIKENGKFIDFAFVSRPHVFYEYADYIKDYSKARIFYIAHDLHFLREKRIARVENDKNKLKQALKTKKIEIEALENSDKSLFFSDKEVEIARRISPNSNPILSPWVQRVFCESKNIEFEKRKGIVFLGGFAHDPNIDAVKWFYGEIFPKIKEELKDVQVMIIGSNITDEIKKMDSGNFRILGFLSDEERDEILRESRIFIAPLRAGAGFKGKVALAMAHAIPVVTTNIGSEGIGLIDGENAMIADDADEFAEKIINIYKDRECWEKISAKAYFHIKNNYSEENIEKYMLNLLK